MQNKENRMCGAKCKDGSKCQNEPTTGKKRCRLHGGLSTGPKTRKGKLAQAASVTKHGRYSKTFSQTTTLPSKYIKALQQQIRNDPKALYDEIVLQLMINLIQNNNPREIASLSNQILKYTKEMSGKDTSTTKSHSEIKRIVKERLLQLGKAIL